MKTTVNGRNVTITEDQKLYFDRKLARFDRLFGDAADANAVLRKAGRDITVEVTIAAGGMLYRSEVTADAWQTALDACVERIERQIRKNKTRLARRLRDNTFIDPGILPAPVPAETEEEEEDGEFVIHTKSFAIKPMSVEEAILQMNLLGHSFFVYRDAETEEINVVYKRKDGAYGRITDAVK